LFNKNSDSYIGKLRSNFIGTEFNIYNSGKNPKNSSNFDQVRHQLGSIVYKTNFMGTKGPRKMTVLLPLVGDS
jgi:tubby-related protein 1